MSVVTISQKGWVVIPAELRHKYQWKTGDRVKVVDYGGVVSLIPVLRNPEAQAMGALRTRGHSLLKALRHSRRQERREPAVK